MVHWVKYDLGSNEVIRPGLIGPSDPIVLDRVKWQLILFDFSDKKRAIPTGNRIFRQK